MTWKTAPALAVSLAIVNLAGQSMSAEGQPVRIKSVANELIPACSTPPLASWTLRLHVSGNWTPVHPGRHVRIQYSGLGGNDGEVDPKFQKGVKNPFHIDTTKLPTGNPTSDNWAKVRIILMDPTMHFADWDVIPPPPAPAVPIHIHGVGSIGNSDNMLCGLTFEKNGGPDQEWDIAQFFIRIKTSGTLIDRPFTFAIYGDDAPQTPVLIDPSVKNYG